MDGERGKRGGTSNSAEDLAPGLSDWLRQRIEFWRSSSPRFDCFCKHYQKKIAYKFRRAKSAEDNRDAFAEIEAAYRLLRIPAFRVEYEREKEGPDFCVSSRFGDFYAEVKRIREIAAATKFLDCVNQLMSEIRKLNPSVNVLLFFRLNDGSRENKEDNESYAKALSQAMNPLIAECVGIIRGAEDHLKTGTTTTFSSAVFPDLDVQLTRDDKPCPGSVSPFYPLFYTQKESWKLSDIICGYLQKQLKLESRNVLIVLSHSSNSRRSRKPVKTGGTAEAFS
jgi:hypothetical protein